VAEAAKIIENTQRDVNIALMNELSILFNRMGINTFDVLKAAGTKWNFLPFSPGLVGGHCIGVDPYYLVHKASELKYHTQMVASGRFVNDSMGGYIAKQTVKRLLVAGGRGNTDESIRVLVMGFTYKENVSDVRNTKVADIVKELMSYNIDVDVIDPKAVAKDVFEEYNIELATAASGVYDAVILAVPHREYRDLSLDDFSDLLVQGGLFVDIKGIRREMENHFQYWSL
jgi:UDP-N-acetyl-D-galactosamine dehydrogenase